MSTNLKGTSAHDLTRFWGGDKRGVCLQVTSQKFSMDVNEPGFVVVTKDEALQLAEALLQFANGTRLEEDAEVKYF